MDSFEDVGIPPELVESLAAEGYEAPTPLQQDAIPLIRKGNNLVLAAGPGSGLLIAWGVPLLERVDPEGDGPSVLVLVADRDTGQRLAESLSRLARAGGHSVAALGGPWASPEGARILFGTAPDMEGALREGSIEGERIQALVVDQAQAIESMYGLDAVERVVSFLSPDTQRVLSALPLTATVQRFTSRQLKRALTIPSVHDPADVPRRGEVRYRIVPEPTEDVLPELVDELLGTDARHVLVFSRSEDQAADIGDRLTLRGFQAGAPGDPSVPVWLGVDPLEARSRISEAHGVVVVSGGVPADPDALDRRHGIAPGGIVLVLPRQLPHLRDVASRTGYTLSPLPRVGATGDDRVRALRDSLVAAVEGEDLGPYLLALAPLFDRYDPGEIAAAAVALLRKRSERAGEGAAPAAPVSTPLPPRAPSWAKLFVTVGTRDGAVPGDLLGAVTGEAGVPGDAVGRIDVRDNHTILEVHDVVADRVIKALNGKTLRGRAVRADYDRPRKSPPTGTRRRVPPGS